MNCSTPGLAVGFSWTRDQTQVSYTGRQIFTTEPPRKLSLWCFITAALANILPPICLPHLGFPGGSAGKESPCNAGDLGSIPGLGRSSGEGKGYPLQYCGQENSMDYKVHGVTKSQTWLSEFHFHFAPELLQLGVWPHPCYQTAHLRAPQHVTWLITPSFLEIFFHLASWTSHYPGFPLTSLSLTMSSVSLFYFFIPDSLYSETLYSSSFCWFFVCLVGWLAGFLPRIIIIKHLCILSL